MDSRSEPTVRYDIFIAGDHAQAKQVCREFCMAVNFGVSVERTDFIYTGGEEAGVRVGIIQYPRYPVPVDRLKTHALALAERLRERLCQRSYTIVGPDQTA